MINAAQAIAPTLEGKTQRQHNPHPPHSPAWLSWILARLGGRNCYDKSPRPKTLRAGSSKLAAMVARHPIAMLLKQENPNNLWAYISSAAISLLV